MRLAILIIAATLSSLTLAHAQEKYDTWPLFQSEFESTGGGGIIIKGYDPVITGNLCKTEFTAVEPNGTIYYNSVEFDAVPEQGGMLCTNGRWKSKDGSATGTTPFKVFFKDGVRRRSP
jgi:hypothetical protein